MATHHDLTIFHHQLATIPDTEFNNLSWNAIVAIAAPEAGPLVIIDKARGVYGLPGLLREASFVGKTLERAVQQGYDSLAGKQRSASHSTGGSFLKFDLDDIGDEELEAAINKLKRLGVGFVAYSTHSHGTVPGLNRVRILVPLDKHVGVVEYQRISQAAAHYLLGRSYDLSEHRPYQLFGFWATHPDRAKSAFRILAEGSPLSSDQMQDYANKLMPAVAASKAPIVTQVLVGSSADLRRLQSAIPWISTSEYGSWIAAMTSCAALVPVYGSDVMVPIAEAISGNAPATSQAKNDERAYSPRRLVEAMSPVMPPAAATGCLLGMARDETVNAVLQDMKVGTWSTRGRAAAEYLAVHHPRRFEQLRSGT